MKKKKKIIFATTLIIMCMAISSAYAEVTSHTMFLMPNDSCKASGSDRYVAASRSGSMRVDYSYSGAKPWSFRANLELRTSWWKPNEVRDSATSPTAWNSSTCSSGQEFRTVVSSTGLTAVPTYLYCKYSN